MVDVMGQLWFEKNFLQSILLIINVFELLSSEGIINLFKVGMNIRKQFVIILGWFSGMVISQNVCVWLQFRFLVVLSSDLLSFFNVEQIGRIMNGRQVQMMLIQMVVFVFRMVSGLLISLS